MAIGILVGAIFILIAGGMAWWNHTNIKKAKAAASWTKCRGKILEQRVDHSISRSRKGGTTHTYNPVISYSYEHDGQTYQGARMNYSNVSYNSLQSAQHALERLSGGLRCRCSGQPGRRRRLHPVGDGQGQLDPADHLRRGGRRGDRPVRHAGVICR